MAGRLNASGLCVDGNSPHPYGKDIPMSQHPKSELLVVHLWSVFLSVVLFAIHTTILFGIADTLRHLAPASGHITHVDLSGPLVIMAAFIILFLTHLLEGAIWAFFLWRKQLLGTFGEAIYFSLTSFSAVGYGDVVLRPPWRAIGAIMAVNGLLLFGCLTAVLFVVIRAIWRVLEEGAPYDFSFTDSAILSKAAFRLASEVKLELRTISRRCPSIVVARNRV